MIYKKILFYLSDYSTVESKTNQERFLIFFVPPKKLKKKQINYIFLKKLQRENEQLKMQILFYTDQNLIVQKYLLFTKHIKKKNQYKYISQI